MTDQCPRLSTAGDLAIHMDIDEDAAAQVFGATGGWLTLANAAVRITANSSCALSDLLTSAGLSDFVVSDLDDLDLPLDAADFHGLKVLSLLEGFTDTVASVALDTAYDSCGYSYRNRGVRTVIDRLRTAGVVMPGDGEDRLCVPSLIAAWMRSVRSDTAMIQEDELLERTLAHALTAYIEVAKPSDSSMTDNALLLARSSRAWHLLDRIAHAVGFPIFFLHPTLSVDVFSTLPVATRREFPVLGDFSALAESIAAAHFSTDQLGSSSRVPSSARQLVAQFTGPCGSMAQRPQPDFIEDGSDLSKIRPAEEPHDVLSMMTRLGDHGDHRQAAELGSRWTSPHAALRPRHLIGLRAAGHFVHSGDYSHALALLHRMDRVVKESAIAGDCLQPAVVAWTALAAYLSGDHSRTDSAMSRFSALDVAPLIMEAAFRPAALVVAAYRCLDRLDVTSAERLLTRMRNFPGMGDLWIHVPVIERRLALLTAKSGSSLLFADEAVEVYSEGRTTAEVGDRLLNLSRAMALTIQGQWRDAEGLLNTFPDSAGMKHVLLALNELLAGHPAQTVARVESYQYHVHLDTRARVMLTGMKAVAYLRTDKLQHAQRAFAETLELSIWAGSLFPIMTLPIADRKVLLGSVSDETTWNRLLAKFGGLNEDAESLRGKLETGGPKIAAKVRAPQLSKRETSLLKLLVQGKSVPEIATDLSLVAGTVKNRLSALYRKLGVRNRASAVAKSQALGLLGPSMD